MKIKNTSILIWINNFINIFQNKKQMMFKRNFHFRLVMNLIINISKVYSRIDFFSKIKFNFNNKMNIMAKIMISFRQILPFNMNIPIKIDLLIFSQIFNLKKNLLSRTSFKFWIGMTKVRVNKIKIICAKKSS